MGAVPGRPAPDAAVFDLDGVITFTARVHAAAWKELFDKYLHSREARYGEPFHPFDADTDYRAFVDGRLRYDGERTFLATRGITLPGGEPSDTPDRETISGLGNRKDLLFLERLARTGVDVDPDAVHFIRDLRDAGVRVGVASSSRNTELILDRVGLTTLFDARVDGVVSDRLGLAGKPHPDIFLECLSLLGAPDASRAMVAEDAITGVAAGKAGGFGLVLGVARGGNANALLEHGADWVIRSFTEISLGDVVRYFEARAQHTSSHAAERTHRG
jgi:HAD superfamily hydrolase (TIGR01509 family)